MFVFVPRMSMHRIMVAIKVLIVVVFVIGNAKAEENEIDDKTEVKKPYTFGYQIQDKDGNQQHRHEQSDSNGVRRGSYGFLDANGVYRIVKYIADDKGFRVNFINSNEPGIGAAADVHLGGKALTRPIPVNGKSSVGVTNLIEEANVPHTRMITTKPLNRQLPLATPQYNGHQPPYYRSTVRGSLPVEEIRNNPYKYLSNYITSPKIRYVGSAYQNHKFASPKSAKSASHQYTDPNRPPYERSFGNYINDLTRTYSKPAVEFKSHLLSPYFEPRVFYADDSQNTPGARPKVEPIKPPAITPPLAPNPVIYHQDQKQPSVVPVYNYFNQDLNYYPNYALPASTGVSPPTQPAPPPPQSTTLELPKSFPSYIPITTRLERPDAPNIDNNAVFMYTPTFAPKIPLSYQLKRIEILNQYPNEKYNKYFDRDAIINFKNKANTGSYNEQPEKPAAPAVTSAPLTGPTAAKRFKHYSQYRASNPFNRF